MPNIEILLMTALLKALCIPLSLDTLKTGPQALGVRNTSYLNASSYH